MGTTRRLIPLRKLRIALGILCAFILQAVLIQPAVAGTRLFSNLQDTTVVNNKNNKIGEVEDLVLRRNGRIKSMLIAINEFLDIGGKDVAVPFKKIVFEKGSSPRLNATVEQLSRLSPFSYSQVGLYTGILYQPPPISNKWYQAPYDPYFDPFSPHSQGQERWKRMPNGSPDQFSPPDRANRWGPNPQYRLFFPRKILASALIGQYVLNRRGWEVAQVSDLLVDDSGKISHLLFSVGGFLDIGDKTVAVPYKPLRFTAYGIIYDISEKKLEEMPAFKSSS